MELVSTEHGLLVLGLIIIRGTLIWKIGVSVYRGIGRGWRGVWIHDKCWSCHSWAVESWWKFMAGWCMLWTVYLVAMIQFLDVTRWRTIILVLLLLFVSFLGKPLRFTQYCMRKLTCATVFSHLYSHALSTAYSCSPNVHNETGHVMKITVAKRNPHMKLTQQTCKRTIQNKN